MKRKIKIFILYCFKYFGIFAIARYLSRNALQILCYHNFTKGDEISCTPAMIMHPETLHKRLATIKKSGFTILSLTEALDKLYDTNSTLPRNTIAITIDDGWYNTLTLADPVFKEFNYPYTIYVTSYYSRIQLPLFNMVVPYMVCKATEINRDKISKLIGFTISTTQPEAIAKKIIKYGYGKLNTQQREEFTYQLGEILGVSYKEITKNKTYHLLSENDIRLLDERGVDIQLHTHRHTFPNETHSAITEITQNRDFLQPLTSSSLTHFCYPSGDWNTQHFTALEQCGIASATTCDHGFNTRQTHKYALKRFLDGENVSQIEFEAALCGVIEIARRVKKLYKNLKP